MPTKPFAIHQLEGTDRSRVKVREANKLHLDPGDIGGAPKWLAPEGKAEWKRVTSHSKLRQVLTAADRPLLAHHCVLWERFAQDARGERNMTASERQTFHSIQMQLGFTPAARSKVIAPTEHKREHEWAI